MLRTTSVLAAIVLLACSLASAQWLETQINLPDSAWPHELVYNPQDNKVYCANYGTDNVTIVDGATNDIIATVATGAHPNALCYNSANDRVYCAISGSASVSVIDGATNDVIATVPVGNTPLDLCYNPQNNKVYCANQLANSVSIIDGASNSVIASPRVGAGPDRLLYYEPANKVFVANGVGFSINVIDGTTNEVLDTIPANCPGKFGSNPDNDKVYNLSVNRYRIYVIDGTTNALLDSIMFDYTNTPQEMCYCPQNNQVYVAINAGTFSWVMVMDGVTNARTDSISTNPLPNLILYNRYTDKMLTADDGAYTVQVIDCATNTITHTIAIDTAPDCMCWNPTYNRVYVGCYAYLPYPPIRTSSICVIRDSGGGVQEMENGEVRREKAGATVVRGVLRLPGPALLHSSFSLLNSAGRSVMELRPGDNDVSSLAPGVYFVYRGSDAKRIAPRVVKVVLQR